MLTGDLDEYSIAALAAAPVDGYGVGTSLVTGSGAPTAALVYKLVARAREDDGGGPLRPVAKRSVGKPSRGGRKWAVREIGPDGRAIAERVIDTPPEPGAGAGRCSSSWCAAARSSAASPSTRARTRHAPRSPSSRRTPWPCPAATRPSPRPSLPTPSNGPRSPAPAPDQASGHLPADQAPHPRTGSDEPSHPRPQATRHAAADSSGQWTGIHRTAHRPRAGRDWRGAECPASRTRQPRWSRCRKWRSSSDRRWL